MDEETERINKAYEMIVSQRKGYQPIYGFPENKVGAEKFFERRVQIILDYCGRDKSYLVLGCNLGYTAFGIVRAGGRAVGVDGDRGAIDFCNYPLKVHYRCEESNPIFVTSDVFKFFDTNEQSFDCITALMLLHNVLKNHTMQQTLELVNKMADKTDCLIVQSRHVQWCRDGFDMIYTDVPRFIVEHTKFNSYEIITDGKNPRIAIGLPLWAFKN